jgi:hypothetical protein
LRRIVTSDWQLADGARDRYRLDFVVKTLPELVNKYKVDQLLVLGDITEAKDAHPAPLVNEIVNCFSNLSQVCEIIILQGNHDFLHNAHPFFEFVSCFDNVSWISVPTVRANCLYLPHTRDYKKEWAHLDLKSNYDYVFAHNIFTGVNAANGHALSGIPPTIFGENFVVSGDVHEPQTFDCITYVGSPTLCDFGDSYQPRVLLLDDLKVKSIKVYGQQKRLIKVDWGNTEDDIVFHHPDAREGDIVKMQVNLQMEHVAEWAKIRELVEQWATKRNFVVYAIVPIVAYDSGKRQSIVNSSRKSDTEYLQSFVSRLGVDERTAAVGKEIIELV